MADAQNSLTLRIKQNITKVINEEEKMMFGDSSSLHLHLLCSMGSQVLHGCQSPPQMTWLPIKFAFHVKDHYPRLGQALLASMQHHFWNLSEHLVLLALANDDLELELKSKILELLDSELPELFKIGKPDLPVVLMSTELSDLLVHRAASFWKWQMFPKGRWRSGKVEKPISPLTLSRTL